MSIEEKAKAYDEALKQAKNIKSKILQSHLSTESCKAVSEYIDEIIPELRESEDERIIEEIKFAVMQMPTERQDTKDKCLAWLEKQKEIHMPSSPALIKMWEEVEAMLKEKEHENEREWGTWRIAYNAFLEGFGKGFMVKRDYFEKQKESSLRDFIDDFPYSDQQEQKPAECSRQSIIDALTKWLTEKISPLHKKSLDGTITEREEMFEAALLEMRSLVNSPDFQIGKDTSAEWSEEDERMLSRCEKSIESSKQFADSDTFKKAKDNEIDWLENRFKSLRPSWKPSKEQIDRLFSIVVALRKDHCDDMADVIAEIYHELEKLM